MSTHMANLHILLSLLLICSTQAANLSQLVKKQTQVKQPQQQQQQQQQAASHMAAAGQQYAHEAELPAEQQQDMKSEEEDDSYQMMHEFKQDSRMPASATNFAWNPYTAAAAAATAANPFESMAPPAPALPMPKMLPFIGYAQPLLIPFPLYIAPDMFYPSYPGAGNDLEDVVMSRAAGDRRPSAAQAARNSPIYYVRLPPTPYMFVPTNLAPTPFANSFSPLLTYQPMPTFSTFGSVFNLPVNFLANGKPSGIYQMNGAAGDMASYTPGYGSNFNLRPPTPTNPYRPPPVANYGHAPQKQGFGLASLPAPQQDSKLTSLKRPFLFNGRPEDIYILPNNVNSLYNYNEQNYY
ncbi:PREDICTED: COPII coat assembly protein sec16 [Drosophila arizonae]|uniref:COPII coat assembly protein sec16 n=1 Tax=Drosophila arizonae TaxID=7263 RepID=A0ABM1NQ79_DROAR|nr:PREDICTED: COPII coat assembly protein sec16 [Drosophila arizonae]